MSSETLSKPVATAVPAPSGARVVRPATLAERVYRGKKEAPLRLAVYGMPGVGKTVFASHAPDAIFICAEEGAEQIDVAKTDRPETWDDAIALLRLVAYEKHDFKTLVVDTLDALEGLAIAHVCRVGNKQTLADFDWGKGRQALGDQWRIFLRGCEVARNERGMHVVLLAHSHSKTVNDPQLGSYDRYSPKLDDRVWNLTNEWCDLVGFAQFEAGVDVPKKKTERNRLFLTGARLLQTTRGNGYEAKNRFSLPPSLPLDWDALTRAIAAHGVAPDAVLRDQLTALLTEVDDAGVSERARAYLTKYGDNAQTLAEAINFIRPILEEKRAAMPETAQASQMQHTEKGE